MNDTSPANSAIDIAHLTHRYQPDDRPALDDFSLSIAPQSLFGILGPNGSGKTTLFRILTTLLRPTACEHLRMFGHDVHRCPQAVRSLLGIVFQSPSLDAQLTVRENLRHHGHLFGLRGPELTRHIEMQLTQFGLLERANVFVGKLSGGQRRRVEIAKALLPEPKLLLLDEPSTGLDPSARRDLWEILSNLRQAQQVTVVLTTHFMEEADRCDDLAILHQGRLIAHGSPVKLKSSIGGDVVILTPTVEMESTELVNEISTRWGPWTSQTQPRQVDGVIRLEHAQGPQLAATIASALPGKFAALLVTKPTLEDVFMHATGDRFNEPATADLA